MRFVSSNLSSVELSFWSRVTPREQCLFALFIDDVDHERMIAGHEFPFPHSPPWWHWIASRRSCGSQNLVEISLYLKHAPRRHTKEGIVQPRISPLLTEILLCVATQRSIFSVHKSCSVSMRSLILSVSQYISHLDECLLDEMTFILHPLITPQTSPFPCHLQLPLL